MSAIRVVLPAHLRALAHIDGEIVVEAPAATLAAVLASVEERYPMLRGTMRDPQTGRRRAFVRFFACNADLSQQGVEVALPAPVATGREPLLVIGAMAGG
jgi:molybdopterin synthase sulfur carrier subunit